MSDSEDDVPLGHRAAQKPDDTTKEDVAAPLNSTDANKPAVTDMSDDEDDTPLGQRATAASTGPSKPATASTKPAAKPAAKVGAAEAKKSAAAAKAPPAKPAAKAKIKEEDAGDSGSDGAPAAKPSKAAKPAAKAAKVKAEDGAAASQPSKAPRVKKEFDLPGQTRETPPEADPLRKFYTSLLSQNPGSEMAKKWCVQNGLLSRDEAEAWLESQRDMKQKHKSPMKASNGHSRTAAKQHKPERPKPAAAKPNVAAKGKAPGKRKKQDSSDDDDDASEDEEEEEFKPQKKKRPPPVKKRRDVAFADGGLDDSDDDVPLAMKTLRQ